MRFKLYAKNVISVRSGVEESVVMTAFMEHEVAKVCILGDTLAQSCSVSFPLRRFSRCVYEEMKIIK